MDRCLTCSDFGHVAPTCQKEKKMKAKLELGEDQIKDLIKEALCARQHSFTSISVVNLIGHPAEDDGPCRYSAAYVTAEVTVDL